MQKGLSFIGLMPSAEEKDLIKRVIAVGGDTVECKGTGPVKVNGKALDESRTSTRATPRARRRPFGPIKVPKGRIWVMGDHRQDSLDSRYHQNAGTTASVPVKDVVGRAIVMAWPINRWGTLPVPDTSTRPGIGTQRPRPRPAVRPGGRRPHRVGAGRHLATPAGRLGRADRRPSSGGRSLPESRIPAVACCSWAGVLSKAGYVVGAKAAGQVRPHGRPPSAGSGADGRVGQQGTTDAARQQCCRGWPWPSAVCSSWAASSGAAVVYRPYTVPTDSMTPDDGPGTGCWPSGSTAARCARGDIVVFNDKLWATCRHGQARRRRRR